MHNHLVPEIEIEKIVNCTECGVRMHVFANPLESSSGWLCGECFERATDEALEN